MTIFVFAKNILNLIYFLMVLIVASGVIGCATDSAKTKNAEQEVNEDLGFLLLFSVKEPGTDFYESRVYVNKKIALMRDARAEKDYLLFDRKKRTIYSVNSADKSIFVITPKDVNVESPIKLQYVEQSQPSAAIPKVQNLPATHFRYDANGEHCYDVVAMPEEFLTEVTIAMREFRSVLAGEHASTVGNIPKDVLDPCDLALNIFYPTKHLEHGLPIREWDQKGYQRFLLKYHDDVLAEKSEYELPKDYHQYSISDM